MASEDTLVLSAAYYASEAGCQCLVDSARMLDIPLQLYGIGEGWPWWREGKIRRLRDEIKARRRQHQFVLFVDSFDVFFLKGLDVIEQRYRAMMSPIVLSAQSTPWPFGAWAERYPETASPFRYVNCGSVIGEIPVMLRLLDWLYEDFPQWNSDDQASWTQAYLEHPEFGIKLDTQCELFQTMSNTECMVRKRGVFYNSATDSCPCLLHYNGRTGGMQEDFDWWKAPHEAEPRLW